MAVERMVRAGILESDAVNSLGWASEVFYRRLHSVVDDFGRYDGRIAILRAKCYPLKLDHVSGADVEKWLHDCCRAGLVSAYEVKGKPYIIVHKFSQRLRSKSSKYPDPEEGQMLAFDSKLNKIADKSPPVADTENNLLTNVRTPLTNALEVEEEVEEEGEVEVEVEKNAHSRATSSTSEKPDLIELEKPKSEILSKPQEQIPPDSAAPPFVHFSKTRLHIDRLKELFLEDQIGAEAVCMTHSWGNFEMLAAWLDYFNLWRTQQGETSDNQKNYRSHFLAWIRKQPYQEDPKKLIIQKQKNQSNDKRSENNTRGGQSYEDRFPELAQIAREMGNESGT